MSARKSNKSSRRSLNLTSVSSMVRIWSLHLQDVDSISTQRKLLSSNSFLSLRNTSCCDQLKNLPRVSQAVWRSLWERKIIGSIPILSTNHDTVTQLVECQSEKLEVSGAEPLGVKCLYSLKARQLLYKQLSGRLPRDLGSSPSTSKYSMGEMGKSVSLPVCNTGSARNSQFDPDLTHHFPGIFQR
jgi:hypothetical protein